MKRALFTKEGFEKLQTEQKELIEKRKITVDHLRRAREMGDLSENGYYKAAKFELGQLDRRLRQVKFLLQTARIASVSGVDSVSIGCTVTVKSDSGETQYTIVGDYEANPLDNKLSAKSPMGNALIGKKPGETVAVTTPRGTIELVILSIS